MDKRVWDLPLIEAKDDVYHVLSILGGRNHIWVVKDKKTKEIKAIFAGKASNTKGFKLE